MKTFTILEMQVFNLTMHARVSLKLQIYRKSISV